MICKKCYTNNEDNAKECISCGNRFDNLKEERPKNKKYDNKDKQDLIEEKNNEIFIEESDNKELKKRAAKRINGHYKEFLIQIIISGMLPYIIISLIGSFTFSIVNNMRLEDNYYIIILTMLLIIVYPLCYYIKVGVTSNVIKFIKKQKYRFSDIFFYTKDYKKILMVYIKQYWLIALLVIILGVLLFNLENPYALLRIIVLILPILLIIIIIKRINYALVPILLTDKKYNNLGYLDYIKKSEEMMFGHKMDYFMLNLSCLKWFFISILSLFLIFSITMLSLENSGTSGLIFFLVFILILYLLCIGILIYYVLNVPRKKIATTKFLLDVKESYEKNKKS